jgi:small subunit ribosomal protein S20
MLLWASSVVGRRSSKKGVDLKSPRAIIARLFLPTGKVGKTERDSMPNIKSAEKRMRQTVTCTEINKSKKSRINSTRRTLLEAVESGDKTKAQAALTGFCSALDKGAKTGVIKSNKADRSKSRATKSVAKIEG